MLKKSLSTPILLLSYCLFFFTSYTGLSQDVIRFKTFRPTSEEEVALKPQFKDYTIATLGTAQINQLLRSKEYFQDLKLEVNGQSYSFNLRARDLRAPNYKLRAWTENGVVELPRSPNKTYYGYTKEGQYDVRITADDDFFYAMISQQNDEIFIEPARHLIPNAAANKYVIYRGSDSLKKFTNSACGVNYTAPIQTPHNETNDPLSNQSNSRACKVVQIALADDKLMFLQYGSVSAVEDHNLAVINNVETNYDDEFNVDLQFSIVEIYVATNNATDPWTDNTDSGALLDDFTSWGPGGFENTHDIGGLWSNRNFDGDIIGLAWLSTVCNNFKYAVFEDFSSNASFLRVLQAHEMGHNFSANHDAAGSNTIMAPSVNNSNTWSTNSINSINSKINQVSCLAACGIPSAPIADFDADLTEGCAPMTVHFDDQSANNPTSWSWNFEGGSPPTSSNQNPTVNYNNPGTFNVSLTVSNAQGSNSITLTNFITVNEGPFADFDYFIHDLEVDFENTSGNATSYSWNFGDGSTSNQTNPTHEYEEDGIYTVTLTATNECGTDVYIVEIEIITLPVAFFSSDIVEGCSPMEVEFINLSSPNALFFKWTFPGGSPPTSFNYEPVVLYEIPGTYNVTLVVTNDAGEDIQTVNNYITVSAQPVAEFSSTTNGLQATFNSTGSVGDSYAWNFGDGQNSTAHNPVHVYTTAGTYQVTLTVNNDCGSDVLTLPVTVTGAPVAGFISNTQNGCAPLVVQFTNQSAGSPTAFIWVFEGGVPASSTQPNPTVTYFNQGTFDVQLTVTNPTGNNTLSLPDYIHIASPTTSNFIFDVNGTNADFTNQSSNDIGSSWTFGDGDTSPETNPSHTYPEDGVYTVRLISAGICGNDTSYSQVTIQTPPNAAFAYQQMTDCVPAIVAFTNQSSQNATSFLWSFPGGSPSTSTQVNPSITYNAKGTYSVSLIAYSAAGSDTLSWDDLIEVGSAPTASFLLSTDDTSVTFDNQSTGASSYFWDFGDGEFSSAIDPVHDYGSFGIYTVMLISTNSCGEDTSTIVIELSTLPNAFFSFSAHSGCAPFVINFIDQSQNNPTSWNWAFEGGNPATSTLQNPSVSYDAPGEYTVSLTVNNGQGADALVLEDLIRVSGAPDATFNHSQNENIVSLEYQGLDYDSIHWSFGDGRTDGSLNPTVEYTVSGDYEISLIVFNGCGTDTMSVWVTITITSTTDPSDNLSHWQIRPNPFKDILTIYGQPLSSGTATLSLLDVHGSLISTQKWNYTSGQALKEINAGNLPAGVILVLIQDQDSRVVLKAVHQQ